MARLTWIGKFLIWRKKRINDKYFLILLSFIVGLLAGISAYLLKSFVHIVKSLVLSGFAHNEQLYWLLLLPLMGIILTVLFIRYIIKDNTEQGIPRILYVISRLDGKMRWHKYFSSLIGSSLTAGFGGSVGLESPIIAAGASVGSTLGQFLRISYSHRTLLIGCGAAGAIASIFTTPVAAVIFSLEVLMLDLTTASIIPLLISSVTGAITTKMLLADEILVHFKVNQDFEVEVFYLYILLGILCGLVSLYFHSSYVFIQERFSRIKKTQYKVLIGGLLLGLMIFLFPPLYGEGYSAIREILSGDAAQLMDNTVFYAFREHEWVFIAFLITIVVLKVIATALTTESGGIGGIFAPAAVSGGVTGYIFARLLNDSGLFSRVHEVNFTLVGMAGVLGAVLHAPLTAIFLIAEMTNGYELIVPLMLSTAVSFVTIRMFASHSLFTMHLARAGALITHHKDKTVLTLLNVSQLIDKDLIRVSPKDSLGDLTKVIARSKRNIYPVLLDDGTYLGLVDLDDVRDDMFRPEKYDASIMDYMIQADAHVSTKDSMEQVMDKFNKSGHYNLPVIDDGKYRGFVSRANIFKAYRQTLIDVSAED